MGTLLASVVVPTVPVSSYGDGLLSFLGTIVVPILPYAAGVTVFAIGVGMLKRWLGHRRSTDLTFSERVQQGVGRKGLTSAQLREINGSDDPFA